MRRWPFILLVLSCCLVPPAFGAGEKPAEEGIAPPTVAVVSVQNSFLIEPLAPEVFAAIAKPGGQATTNAIFVIGTEYVVAAGAHMSKPVVEDLYKAIAARTDKPVKYFILTHHHSGYTFVDFDFPPGQDVLMSLPTWEGIKAESRYANYPVLFFNEGMTIKPGRVSMVLTNVGKGHTEGDVVVMIPEANVVFASDLVYVNSVGYMGSGHMTEWLLALDFLAQLDARQVVPGFGPVSSSDDIYDFSFFFRDFLTEVLVHIERGDTLEKALADFDLPRYRDLAGYDQLIELNLKRAYRELKASFGTN